MSDFRLPDISILLVTDLETRSGEEPPTPMTPELIPAPIMPGWLARSGVELEKVVVGGWR